MPDKPEVSMEQEGEFVTQKAEEEFLYGNYGFVPTGRPDARHLEYGLIRVELKRVALEIVEWEADIAGVTAKYQDPTFLPTGYDERKAAIADLAYVYEQHHAVLGARAEFEEAVKILRSKGFELSDDPKNYATLGSGEESAE